MDRRKAHPSRLGDVGQRIVDEQTFLWEFTDLLKHDLENLRVGLDVPDLSRYDDVIEQSQKIIFVPSVGKGLCGPIAQPVECISCFFELLQDAHRSRDRASDRINPVIVIGLDQVCVMRKLPGKNRNAFRKGTSLILLQVPVHEIDFFEEELHCIRIVREITLIDVPGIPLEQNVAEIENDGFDLSGHGLILKHPCGTPVIGECEWISLC